MRQERLGTAGPLVSAIGLGCNNFGYLDLEASRAVVHKALDVGVTMFDTADVYGLGTSETYLGQILGDRRKDVLIASKFGVGQPSPAPSYNSASRAYIMEAVEASLRRLNTDYIDLYQSHFYDWATPFEETLRALDDLVKQGKIRYVGLCNHEGWQLADAAWITKSIGLAPVVSMQNEYNILQRGPEDSVIPAARHFGAGLMPWAPLASGLLTGKYRSDRALPNDGRLAVSRWKSLIDRTLNERNWQLLEELEAFAEKRGRTLLEIAYGWLRSRATVTCIIAGATKAEQVEANVAAANVELSDEDIAELDEITRTDPAPLPQRPITEIRTSPRAAA